MKVRCTNYGVIHGNAWCDECGLNWGGYTVKDSARRKAYEHTRRTGHVTTAEMGTAMRYESKEVSK